MAATIHFLTVTVTYPWPFPVPNPDPNPDPVPVPDLSRQQPPPITAPHDGDTSSLMNYFEDKPEAEDEVITFEQRNPGAPVLPRVSSSYSCLLLSNYKPIHNAKLNQMTLM